MLHAKSTRSDAGARGAPERRYLSEQELSVYAGLSTRTLQNWRLFNEGPPFRKLGRAVRYALDEFERWAAAQPGGGEEA